MGRLWFLIALVVCMAPSACSRKGGTENGVLAPEQDSTVPYGALPNPAAESLTVAERFELYRLAIEAAVTNRRELGWGHLEPEVLVDAFPQLGSQPAPRAESITATEEYWLNRAAFVTLAKANPGLLERRLHAEQTLAEMDACGKAVCKQVSTNVQKCRNGCISWWQISLWFDGTYDLCIRMDGHPMTCPD